MRLFLAVSLGLLAGVALTVVIATAIRGETLAEGIRDGLVISIPAIIGGLALSWWVHRRREQ